MTTLSEAQFQQLLATSTNALRDMTQLQQSQLPQPGDPTRQFDVLSGRLTQFVYDPDKNITFEAWYRRHEDVFAVDGATLDDATRVRLLPQKLDIPVYKKYANYILPRAPRNVNFADMIAVLTDLFGPQQSLLNARYACMKLAKQPREDFVAYAGRVNRECANFRFGTYTEDQFKCLIFVCGLQSSNDAFIRLKLLDKIEMDPTCTIETLTEECKRLLNLRHDTQMIENGSSSTQTVYSVQQNFPSQRRPQPAQRNQIPQSGNQVKGQTRRSNAPRIPPTPCWFCGAMHFNRDCDFRQHRCFLCQTTGHKEGFCNLPNAAQGTSAGQNNVLRPHIKEDKHDQVQFPPSQGSTAPNIDASKSSQWTTKQSASKWIVHQMLRSSASQHGSSLDDQIHNKCKNRSQICRALCHAYVDM